MKTEKGNKLIAEFLGWEQSPNVPEVWTPSWNCPFSNKIPTTCPYTEGLYFNESWDWLMPVVEKIADIKRWNTHHTLEYLAGNNWSTINDVYISVIDYIKEYEKTNN